MINFEGRHPNIKDMTLEEPEKRVELPFDAEKEISEGEWKVIQDEVRRWIEELYADDKSAPDNRMWLPLFWFKVISPERFSRLLVRDVDTLWERGRLSLKRTETNIPRWRAEAAAALKSLIPEHAQDIESDEELFRDLKEDLDGYTTATDSDYFRALERLASIKLLNPNRIHEFKLEKWMYDKGREELGEYHSANPNRNLYRGIRIAASLKILFPEESSGLKLSSLMLEDMKYGIHSSLDPRDPEGPLCHVALQNAFVLKLIAAEKLEISENGLTLVMPKAKLEFQNPTPPLPERRKF